MPVIKFRSFWTPAVTEFIKVFLCRFWPSPLSAVYFNLFIITYLLNLLWLYHVIYNSVSKINCDNIFPTVMRGFNATLSYHLIIIYCIDTTVLHMFIIIIMIFFNNFYNLDGFINFEPIIEPKYFAKVNNQVYVIEQPSWKRIHMAIL